MSGYMYTQHSRGDNIIGMDFSPSYTMEQSEREEIQAQIDSCVEELLTGIPTEASDYEKVKYDFEYLSKRNLVLDIKIIINTVLKVAKSEGIK